jgi:hypothetical protein
MKFLTNKAPLLVCQTRGIIPTMWQALDISFRTCRG